ncbi:MAG: mandelate racemase/muconate lactonizing enzyme family protein [Pseudomonadota bacterium]
MKITRITSHVLRYDLPEELGYSQQFYAQRTAHLVEIETDEGVTGWGECFGPGNIAIANRTIVETVIQPILLGEDPMKRDVLWHRVYNLLRDHGQKGMPIQALSGIDIALWDIAGKVTGQPLHQMLGGAYRDTVSVYGYGMMLRREPIDVLAGRFRDEAAEIRAMGFTATKMKVGRGTSEDIRLAEAVRDGVGDDYPFMVDANHCYTTGDALDVGRALDDLDAYWFEEPVAPEDHRGYRELRTQLKTQIAGGEAEFTRWGWRDLIASEGLDIAQPEVCALGGISEYLRVLALCHANFIPVVNHVWGSGVAIATNLHLLAAMPPLPGGLHPREPMLEFDTTHNLFQDDLLTEPMDIRGQVKRNGGRVAIPDGPGIGVTPDRDFINHHSVFH